MGPVWAWLIALWAWLIALWEGLFDHMGGAYRIVGVVRAFKQSLDMGSVEVGVAYRVAGGAYGHVGGAYFVGVARASKQLPGDGLRVEGVGGAGVGVAYRFVGVAYGHVGGASRPRRPWWRRWTTCCGRKLWSRGGT